MGRKQTFRQCPEWVASRRFLYVRAVALSRVCAAQNILTANTALVKIMIVAAIRAPKKLSIGSQTQTTTIIRPNGISFQGVNATRAGGASHQVAVDPKNRMVESSPRTGDCKADAAAASKIAVVAIAISRTECATRIAIALRS
jgi:hypothetical protein